jgi:hypothetical protein
VDVVKLGERLKGERERRGVALEEVHASTKIQTRYLEALEAQKWDVFPGAVFTQGYLRTYAQYLGLDPQQILKAYARERRIEHTVRGTGADRETEDREVVRAVLERIAQTQGIDLARRRRTIRGVVVGVATLVVATAAVWGVVRVHDLWAGAAGTEPSSPEVRAGASWSFAPPSSAGTRGSRTSGSPSGQAPTAPPAVPELATPPSWALDSPLPPGTENTPLLEGAAGSPETEFVPAPSPEGKALGHLPQGSSRLSVPQYGVGRRVVNHRLVDETGEFAEGKDVWFWTRVDGGGRGDRVHHVWIHDGRRVEVVKLKLGSSQWRTQSRRRMAAGAAGRWTVEARDPEGQLLATVDFRVAPR